MSEFGKRKLVVWYSTGNDYYHIDGHKAFGPGSTFIAVSEPFEVDIIESQNGAEKVNSAKIERVDEKINAARALLETLKGERANLLALPGSSTDET